MYLHLPSIFLTTLALVAAMLSLMTVVGRMWADLIPFRFSASARFYLAPTFGLSVLVVLSNFIGWVLPLGDTLVVPFVAIGLLLFSLKRESQLKQALLHALVVSVFGILCGSSVLGALYFYGAFDTQNDSFTYLAHARWLQENSFSTLVSSETVTPLTTQIMLYQSLGLRMGGSFLLAFIQALFNLRWASEVYPALLIVSLSVNCLAIGFPLASMLRPLRRYMRLALLALISVSWGGLVFGANWGFLPQSVGLAIGSGFLFLSGSSLSWVARERNSWLKIAQLALVNSLLFIAVVFSYSELSPFILLAALITGFFVALKFNSWVRVFAFFSIFALAATLLLNIELQRVYIALVGQSGAIVGTPVDWTLLGYAAHSMGLHGGAWDTYQWSSPEFNGTLTANIGLLMLGFVVTLIVSRWRQIFVLVTSGELMPVIIVLIIFLVGLLYFRYFVPSPFGKGTGQSWSQFKLSEWAHPFVSVLILLPIANISLKLGRYFNVVIICTLFIGIIFSLNASVSRLGYRADYYRGARNLNTFYFDFRDLVHSECPQDSAVYLALGQEHHKFKQLATYFLYDREVKSNWMDDGYIFYRLPVASRIQELRPGDCVVEPASQDSLLESSTVHGPFQIGIFKGGQIRIASVSGAHARESGVGGWWHWIEREIVFDLEPLFIAEDARMTRLYFEYASRGPMTLTVRVEKRDGSHEEWSVPTDKQTSVFNTMIDVSPAEVTRLIIASDGLATPLGEKDNRISSWNIRNVAVSRGD